MELSDQDVRFLRNFVEEVLCVIKNDEEGITSELEEHALNAGQILGMSKLEMEYID